jgi:hypothetical protein
MRGVVFVLVVLECAPAGLGQDAKELPRRYEIAPDLKTYPQANPQEALASVLKAIQNKRIDYLLAQLADPDWVDGRCKVLEGGFARLVEESTVKLSDDPTAFKRLSRLAKDGEWKIAADSATVQMKDRGGPAVFFRKIGGRWFLENRKNQG